MFSSSFRGGIFFAANLSAGLSAATGAMCAEFAYRSVAAGFYGAITQHFQAAKPRWLSGALLTIGIPVVSHSIEFGIHSIRHTPHLRTSLLASVGFTVLSTLFNIHAMRQGILRVGAEGRSIRHDLVLLPRVIAAVFVSRLAGDRDEGGPPP